MSIYCSHSLVVLEDFKCSFFSARALLILAITPSLQILSTDIDPVLQITAHGMLFMLFRVCKYRYLRE